ncbi:MAG TPA: prepilin-type N-terminal cleavage/methylation domain-containing protein [Fimbriimonadaceae bacterium]|nr:prepilin-type N-terminal cleavage/methylation domain-containing protein [Fimbriimonadaceae bacterium]HRJ33618.1 prepilin-type N-terminal cleavage/methylation domain-containing protein [Fimbriimonadaceae bacterium]
MKRSTPKRKKQRGATLTEVVMAAALSALAMAGATAAFMSGMKSWATGQGKINADMEAQQTIRTITAELREAMSVVVDANGMGVTYRLPQKTSGGAFVVPATWDGVVRRIELSNGKLCILENGKSRVIARDIISSDPQRNNQNYSIFTAGPGAITREIDVMIVSRTASYQNKTTFSRVRETLFLRNIPSLSR